MHISMQVLGLDIGFSRTGFALGNTVTGLAFPREIVAYTDYIQKIIWYLESSGEGIEKIVVGMPNMLSGGESDHMQKIAKEIHKIRTIASDFSVEVDEYDEQFTSKIAEQSLYLMGFSAKKQKGKKDNMAAAIILQGYLDRQKNLDTHLL